MAQAAAAGDPYRQESLLRSAVDVYFESPREMPSLPRLPVLPGGTGGGTDGGTGGGTDGSTGGGTGSGAGEAGRGEEEGQGDRVENEAGCVQLPVQMAPERAGPQVAAFIRTLRDRISGMVRVPAAACLIPIVLLLCGLCVLLLLLGAIG